MSIRLRELREDDLENIMRWRMDPDITRYMNTNPKLTLEGQRKWFKAICGNTDVRYWLIEIDGESAGVINLTGLDRADGCAGWAYYVGEKRLRSMIRFVATISTRKGTSIATASASTSFINFTNVSRGSPVFCTSPAETW